MAHRGTVVAPIRLEDLLAAYAAREVLEGAAARSVANRPAPGTIQELERIHAAMEKAYAEQDFALLPKLNLEFHAALREGSNNPYLQRFLLQIEHVVRRVGSQTAGLTTRAAATLQEHGAILDAVRAMDPDRAAELAQTHIRNAREARIRRLS